MKVFSKLSRCLAVLMIIVLVFSVSACSDSDTNFPKAEESVNAFFKALGEADLKTAQSYCVSGSDNFTFTDAQEEKFVKLMIQKVKHEIVSSSEEGDTATVKVKVTNLDIEKVFEDMTTKLMGEMLDSALDGKEFSEEETMELTMKYLEESMSSPDAAVKTSELDVTLSKDKGKKMWLIKDNQAFVNGITGNIDALLN